MQLTWLLRTCLTNAESLAASHQVLQSASVYVVQEAAHFHPVGDQRMGTHPVDVVTQRLLLIVDDSPRGP